LIEWPRTHDPLASASQVVGPPCLTLFFFPFNLKSAKKGENSECPIHSH
jgi:hypothetical protein